MTKLTSLHYPFGSPDSIRDQTRSWSDAFGAYRYASPTYIKRQASTIDAFRRVFNGKEKVSETANDDFPIAIGIGARIYDGRLGRWLSLDPLMKKYPNLSSYHFCSNSPIVLKDIDGRDIILTTGFLSSLYNPFYSNVKNNKYVEDLAKKYMISLHAYNFISSTAQANSGGAPNKEGRYESNFNLYSISYYGNDNTLFVSTIMHELLHDKYSTWYNEMVKDGKWTADAKKLHPKMYNYMLKYKNHKEIKVDGKYTQRNWEHQYMADYGRTSIIDAMKEQDKTDKIADRSGVIDGITYTSNDWYEAMSWGGLEGTDSWNLLSEGKKTLYTKLLNNP